MAIKLKDSCFLALIIIAFSANALFGQIADTTSNQVKTPESEWSDSKVSGNIGFIEAMVRGIGALLLIMVLIYGFVWLLRYFMSKKSFGNPTSEYIRVVSTTYVAPKKSVALIQVYDKAVLIGITENSMNMLTELNKDSGWQDLVQETGGAKRGAGSFSRKLSKAIKDNFNKGKIIGRDGSS
ncbi:MAG: flagellar biosynthetic protein FliO [Candidatus Marinimicrobia bacterium]|nr:flagellar biosynthetic protein FliO [Candidatus Neomarinimicrobiota bacterium]